MPLLTSKSNTWFRAWEMKKNPCTHCQPHEINACSHPANWPTSMLTTGQLDKIRACYQAVATVEGAQTPPLEQSISDPQSCKGWVSACTAGSICDKLHCGKHCFQQGFGKQCTSALNYSNSA